MDIEDIVLSPLERRVLATVLAPFADGIDRAAIFGSRALGRSTPASDIDLVLYGPLDERTASRIWSLFDQSCLAVVVDVVRYAGLGPGAFRRHIDQFAVSLFTREDLKAAQPSRVA